MHDVELAGLGAPRAPRLDVFAARLVLGDPGVAETVGHVDVSGRVPRHVGRTLEGLAFGARARQSHGRRLRHRGLRQPPAAHRDRPALLQRRGRHPPADCLQDGNARRLRRERQRRNAERFRLAAQNHLRPPIRIELHHLGRHLVDDPEVVLRIDAHLLRLQQPVRILADLAEELAGSIELEQARSAMRDGPRRAQRDGRIAGARVQEDVALGVGRDTRRFAHVNVERELEQRRVGVERDLGNRRLGGERGGRRHRRGTEETCSSFHGSLLAYFARAELCTFGALSMIFWARQAEISDTNSSFGFRQSIS